MDTIQRRSHLVLPGEALLLMRPDPDTDEDAGTPGVLKQADRLEEFAETSGLASEDLYSSPLVSVPLPIYTGRIPSGQRRWTGTQPIMMWHPLMWLPERLANPYLLTEPDGTERVESADEWAVRVAMELTASGLYDPDSGGWADVLGLHDLDITDPDVQHRLGAWLGGAADEALDAIDLAPYLDAPEDPHWAVQAAHAIFEDVVASSWHIVASDLWAVAAGMQDPAATDAQVRKVVDDVAQLAITLIGDAVVDVDLTLGQRASDFVDSGADPRADLADLVAVLDLVARGYADALGELEQLAALI